MITYNGNGGMDTVAVGLNERGSTLRQLPEGDVQLIRAYAGQHPGRFCSIRPFTSSTACLTAGPGPISSSAWKGSPSAIRRMKISAWPSG